MVSVLREKTQIKFKIGENNWVSEPVSGHVQKRISEVLFNFRDCEIIFPKYAGIILNMFSLKLFFTAVVRYALYDDDQTEIVVENVCSTRSLRATLDTIYLRHYALLPSDGNRNAQIRDRHLHIIPQTQWDDTTLLDYEGEIHVNFMRKRVSFLGKRIEIY